MFKVGDEVIMTYSSAITKGGDIGFVIRKDAWSITVQFHSMKREEYIGESFTIPNSWAEHYGPTMSPIERKIKRMYERQPYFSRYRIGQPAS